MTTLTFRHEYLILDADCGISLYSSGRMSDMLRALPVQAAVVDPVGQSEMRYVLGQEVENGRRAKEPIDLLPLYQDGLLIKISLSSAEYETALYLASLKIGNGEACSAAVAIHRNGAVGSDDVPARRRILHEYPTIQFVTTSEIVKWWVDTDAVPAIEVRAVLHAMQEGSRYGPSPQDTLYRWWRNYV